MNANDSEMGDMKTVDWAIERLNEKRDRPLFLGVGDSSMSESVQTPVSALRE